MADLTKLKSLLYRIDNITHVNKTNKAYYGATELAIELSDLLPDNESIKLDIKILKKYDSKGSDKMKKHFLDEFKENSTHTIVGVISSLESNLPTDL